MWAAKSRAAMNMWLGWLTTLQQLADSGEFLCGLPSLGKRLLLAGKGAKGQMAHSSTVAMSGKSSGYFLIAISSVSAVISITLGPLLYIDHHYV